MPFGGLIRGILEKVHDSLLFPGRILLGIGKLTVFAYASAINFWGRCESSLERSRCRSNSARNPRVLGSRDPYTLTVWKVSQDLICHVSFVTHIHSYEQLQTVEAPITGMN